MARKKTARDDELSTRPSIRKKLLDVFRDVDQGFIDQHDRSDDILDYWDCYNAILGERQFYNGNSQIYVPIVHDAIEARKTRFVNQVFPQSGRYVEVISENGDIPHAQMALLDYYVRRAKLRTQVVPALMVAGDVEGQWNLYADWKSTERHVVSKKSKPIRIDGVEHPDLGEEVDIDIETIEDAGPVAELIADNDVLVLPATSNSIEEALENGGSVTIIRRWSKAKIKKMAASGEIVREVADALTTAMTKVDAPGRKDTAKELASAAGIKTGGASKWVQVYETWTRLKVDGEHRLVRAYYGGEQQILSVKLCPYWNDRCPLISAPTRKTPGVFKGRSPVADVIDQQILANDTCNEAADTMHYSAMPIIMTDPEKNPRIGSMVLGLAAVWETSPNDTQFAQFPKLWQDGFEIIGACKQQIFQTLGVNPAMMPQQTGNRQKRNQAEIANEQQVDLLTTADVVTNIEEAILTPLLQRFAEYDAQFRNDHLLVRSFGEMGLRAKMEEIPPIQMNRRYEYRWFGVEAARTASQVQQQIAMLNVFKGVPPQMYDGYKLDLTAVMTQLAENAFGPRLAPLTFKSLKDQLSLSPMLENDLLVEGMEMPVSPYDDDAEHIKVHMMALQAGDPSGAIRTHLMKHQQQMQMKQAQAMQAGQQGLPGGPGGDGPGVAGTPSGAVPQGPRLLKGPPGMIPPERMAAAGSPIMPRKF